MKKLLLGLAIAASSGALIADNDRSVYFSILGGSQDFHTGDTPENGIQSYSLNHSDAIAAEFGFMITEHAALQLSYSKLNPDDVAGFGDEDLIMQSLDFLYYFKPEGSDGGPYVKLGAGQYEFEDPAAGGGWIESDIVRTAFGVESQMSDFFSIRGELGVIRDVTFNRFDTNLLVGFTFSFGGGSSAAPLPVIKPVAAPVVKTNTRKDSDNDGVFDEVDQCPTTAAGITVDPRGCELDSDGDGVVNSADACPTTPAGARVDGQGCRLVLEEAVQINLDVKFRTNSSELEPAFKSDIQRVADFMRQYPDTKVVIEGHTDSIGKASYNQWLSEKRAATVAAELSSTYGIVASRISSQGLGEAQPIADNNTAQGRAQNRRVVAVIEAIVAKPQ